MKSTTALSLLLAACFLFSPMAAFAEDGEHVWTTAGSAGTLDEDAVGKVFFNRAVVQKGQVFGVDAGSRMVRTNGESVEETDSAVIRYNVTAVDGLFGQAGIGMKIRFLDEGKSARVVAQLIQVNLASGAEDTLLTFDSDDPSVPVVDGYQTVDVFACTKGPGAFDFLQNAYYIEATLTTSSFVAESAAGIKAIQLHVEPCLK